MLKKISKLSIRGQEEHFCKELESMGPLQRFLSYQSKFYFVVRTFAKLICHLGCQCVVTVDFPGLNQENPLF